MLLFFPESKKDGPSLLLVLKWGGELTPAGRVQAEELGRAFRCMYPGGQGTTHSPTRTHQLDQVWTAFSLINEILCDKYATTKKLRKGTNTFLQWCIWK